MSEQSKNIIFKYVDITPNPVNTKGSLIIEAKVEYIQPALDYPHDYPYDFKQS